MNGQIEGLEIGGEALSLWNFKTSQDIQVRKTPIKSFDNAHNLDVDVKLLF